MATPTDGLDPALAAQFEQIRRQFVAGLARRLDEIDNAPDAAALESALHRLAGAAGGYGCADIGDLAQQALRALRAADASAVASALAQLRAEIRTLLA